MPRTIFVSAAAKADCLRIQAVLRRRFKHSIIHVHGNSDRFSDCGLVLADSMDAGVAVPDMAELEKRIRRAEFLLETTRILSSSKALDQGLCDVAEKSTAVIGYTAFIVLIENAPRLQCAVSTRPDQLPQLLNSLINVRSEIKTGLEDLIQSGEAVLIVDLSKLRLPEALGRLTQQFGVKSMVATQIKKDDEVYGVFITLSSAPNEFDESQLILSVEFAQVMARSISQARLIAQLEQKANTDALTGIYNNRFLREILAREVARAGRHLLPLAILMVDVDDFKRVNDVHGHMAGDAALKSLSGILQLSVRREDFVFRYGGDEFGIILPDTDLLGGLRVGEHIRDRVQTADLVLGVGLRGKMTISIGVSEYEAGLDAETLIKRADDALLEAKSSLKNNVKVYRSAASLVGSSDSPS